MSWAIDLVVSHPANAALVRYFAPRYERKQLNAVARPEDVKDPYYGLGTHPDLVTRLWDELGKALAADCRAVFYGNPALIHPTSGIVFGFAGGTHTYALRLPETERAEALRAGATRIMTYPRSPALDVGQFGEEWVLCRWFAQEEAWCRAAFEFAASDGNS
jgi:hypothetical protein